MTVPTNQPTKECDGLVKTETVVNGKKAHIVDVDYSCTVCIGRLDNSTQVQYRHNRFKENEIQVLGTVGAWKISTPKGRRYVAIKES